MSNQKSSKKLAIYGKLKDKGAQERQSNDRQPSIEKQSESAPYGSIKNTGPDADPYGAQSLQSQALPKQSKPTVEVKYGGEHSTNLVLPVIGSQKTIDTEQSIDTIVQLDSRKSMPLNMRPNLQNQVARDLSKQSIKKMNGATDRVAKIPKKRKDYADPETNAQTKEYATDRVRLKKEMTMKKNQQFFNKGKSRQNQLKEKKPEVKTMDEIQEEFLIDGKRQLKMDRARNAVTEMSLTKSMKSISSTNKQSPKQLQSVFQSRTLLENQSEAEFAVTRLHNATSMIGPGAYDLPQIQNGRGFLSNIRNPPAPTFGADMKVHKKSYYHECYKDFIGIDSPGLHKYNPNVQSVKSVQPQFSMPRAERFLIPKSVAKLQRQLPTQYATLNFGKEDSKYASSPKVDLMGLGPRHEFGKYEHKQGFPGQGTYFQQGNPTSIKYKVENSPANSFGHKLAFGSTKEQNDKLQYHGQGRHFYGRENKLGPGAYSPDFSGMDYRHQQNGSISGNKIANVKLARDDRGLLPDRVIEERKKKTYNQSHAQIGPASYGGYEETSTDLFKKTSSVRHERSQKIQKARRMIDLTKWRAENIVLVEKGIGL